MRHDQQRAGFCRGEDVESGVEQAANVSTEKVTDKTVTFKERLSHFTWPWFGATMSTGGISSVIAQTPYQFHGLQGIGKAFFILDLVMFVAFNACLCTRFIGAPRKWFASLHHPVEGLFFGAYWVSIALILNCMPLYGVSSCGPWLVKALEVLFWLYCGLVLLVAIFQYYVLFQKEQLNVADATPAWIFPVYPLLLVGILAGAMIPSQPIGSAYPMWVGAVMLQGLALTVSFMMYTIFTQRLMGSSLPSPPSRPGMFVSVGPASYTSAALISLASQAPKVMPAIAFDADYNNADGKIIKIIGFIAGSFAMLLGFWFFCISTVAVLAGIKKMSFTLNWWAFIFPNAGLTLAAIQLGKVYKSAGIDWIASVMTVLLVLMWFIVVIANIRAVWEKKILWPGKDEDQNPPQ